jgi:hypothetical protein
MAKQDKFKPLAKAPMPETVEPSVDASDVAPDAAEPLAAPVVEDQAPAPVTAPIVRAPAYVVGPHGTVIRNGVTYPPGSSIDLPDGVPSELVGAVVLVSE